MRREVYLFRPEWEGASLRYKGGGFQISRNYPACKPIDIDPGYGAEDGIIHPHMQLGIWLGFGDINGKDYWRLQAKVVFAGVAKPPEGDGVAGSFVARNLLQKDAAKATRSVSAENTKSVGDTFGYHGNQVVWIETTRYQIKNIPEGLLVRLDAKYRSVDQDFYFGDQEESGLAVRVASPIRLQGGDDALLNDRGERNGAHVWGKAAKWFDYYGTIKGRQVGITVVPSPDNPRPSWLHARDYGVVITNPFPKQPKECREPNMKTWVRRGLTYTLSYVNLIRNLPADTPFDRKPVVNILLKSFGRTLGHVNE